MAESAEQPTELPVVANDAPADQSPKVDDAQQKDEDINSKKVTLADLSAKGTALYAHKSYEEAVEIFSEASVLQAEINGEMAPQNAEILFHYGRSLFKVGQSKSDVLGATAGGEKTGNAAPKKSKPTAAPKPAETEAQKVTEEGVALVAEKEQGESIQAAAAKKSAAEGPAANKPLFQFTGDENFDESDDDEVGQDSALHCVDDQIANVSCRNRPTRTRRRRKTTLLRPLRCWTSPAYAISSCSTSQRPRHRTTRARALTKGTRPLFVTSRSAWQILTTVLLRSPSRTRGSSIARYFTP